jgi:hypothetical protein
MMKKIIFLSFLTLGLIACKKDSVTVRPEFIGFWFCDGNSDNPYYIKIGLDGSGFYQEMHGPSIEGDARANDKKLKIGSLHHFTITEYPHKIDTSGSEIMTPTDEHFGLKKANWKMVLKGPNFYLGDGTYYKADY